MAAASERCGSGTPKPRLTPSGYSSRKTLPMSSGYVKSVFEVLSLANGARITVNSPATMRDHIGGGELALPIQMGAL